MLNELRNEVYQNALDHGFYDDEENKNVLLKLMLVVSEISEAAEAYRTNTHTKLELNNVNLTDNLSFEKYIKDTFEDELADTIIRILDLCGYMKIDIDKHIELKMRYNKNRPYKHGKKC
jgi:NTP pyrophosphatase (non-canonical NTP hydrolase)